MKILPLFALVACAPEPFAAIQPVDMEVDWQGRFAGDQCIDGEVDLALVQDADGHFSGIYDYTSVYGHFASYQVEGELDADGLLLVDQVDLFEADDVAGQGWEWCFGAMELALFEGEQGAVIAGPWEPSNCDCSGTVDLSPVE